MPALDGIFDPEIMDHVSQCQGKSDAKQDQQRQVAFEYEIQAGNKHQENSRKVSHDQVDEAFMAHPDEHFPVAGDQGWKIYGVSRIRASVAVGGRGFGGIDDVSVSGIGRGVLFGQAAHLE